MVDPPQARGVTSASYGYDLTYARELLATDFGAFMRARQDHERTRVAPRRAARRLLRREARPARSPKTAARARSSSSRWRSPTRSIRSIDRGDRRRRSRALPVTPRSGCGSRAPCSRTIPTPTSRATRSNGAGASARWSRSRSHLPPRGSSDPQVRARLRQGVPAGRRRRHDRPTARCADARVMSAERLRTAPRVPRAPRVPDARLGRRGRGHRPGRVPALADAPTARRRRAARVPRSHRVAAVPRSDEVGARAARDVRRHVVARAGGRAARANRSRTICRSRCCSRSNACRRSSAPRSCCTTCSTWTTPRSRRRSTAARPRVANSRRAPASTCATNVRGSRRPATRRRGSPRRSSRALHDR